MTDDDRQPSPGTGPEAAKLASDPAVPRLAGPEPTASAPPTASPTRAIRRRARLPSISPEAAAYAAAAYAPATIAAYQADCAHFEHWCAAAGRVALPAPKQSRGSLRIGAPNACATSRCGPGDQGGACRPGMR